MRRLSLVLLLVPGLAAADSTRLDLAPMPELSLLEPTYVLDRHAGSRSSGGLFASVGAGYGLHGDEEGVVGDGTLAIGARVQRLAVGATSSVVVGANDFVRGRHAGLVEWRTEDRRSDDGTVGLMLSAGAVYEHGDARALQPVHVGPGRRHHGAATVDTYLRLEPDKDDMMWAALVHLDGSMTRYLDSPLDRTTRGAAGLGAVMLPDDGEMPRGRIEFLVARVEHANIAHAFSAAGGVLPDNQVRTVEVMAGVNELAGYIDREALFAVTARFGAVWMENETLPSDTLFKVQLGGQFKWLKRRGLRRFGFMLAREPGTTPDGKHFVTDWRLEMLAGVEDSRYVLSARGGISWINQRGTVDDRDTFARYGSQADAFVKVMAGLEVGAYHVMSYEPRVAGDPWSSPRTWATEAGVLARWRGGLL